MTNDGVLEVLHYRLHGPQDIDADVGEELPIAISFINRGVLPTDVVSFAIPLLQHGADFFVHVCHTSPFQYGAAFHSALNLAEPTLGYASPDELSWLQALGAGATNIVLVNHGWCATGTRSGMWRVLAFMAPWDLDDQRHILSKTGTSAWRNVSNIPDDTFSHVTRELVVEAIRRLINHLARHPSCWTCDPGLTRFRRLDPDDEDDFTTSYRGLSALYPAMAPEMAILSDSGHDSSSQQGSGSGSGSGSRSGS